MTAPEATLKRYWVQRRELREHRPVDWQEGQAPVEWVYLTSAVDATIAALRAELAASQRDAERYRWLRKGGDYYLYVINPEAGHIYDENLDKIIDAALATKGDATIPAPDGIRPKGE